MVSLKVESLIGFKNGNWWRQTLNGGINCSTMWGETRSLLLKLVNSWSQPVSQASIPKLYYTFGCIWSFVHISQGHWFDTSTRFPTSSVGLKSEPITSTIPSGLFQPTFTVTDRWSLYLTGYFTSPIFLLLTPLCLTQPLIIRCALDLPSECFSVRVVWTSVSVIPVSACLFPDNYLPAPRSIISWELHLNHKKT